MRSHRLRIPGRHEHRARIGLPEHGRSILARRVIRRRPFCVICLEPCGVEPTIREHSAQREQQRPSAAEREVEREGDLEDAEGRISRGSRIHDGVSPARTSLAGSDTRS